MFQVKACDWKNHPSKQLTFKLLVHELDLKKKNREEERKEKAK